MKGYIQIGIGKGPLCSISEALPVSSAYPLPISKTSTFPAPPQKKQLEIAHHIYDLLQRAKTLQEGKCLLDEANLEVELMILIGAD